jgi:acyl dehydratase
MNAPILFWEDFPVGHAMVSGELVVTEEDIIDFARRFDPQPFHIDIEAAAQGPFGGLVASGWHTTALAMRLLCDTYLLKSAGMGSPGVEQVQWHAPVRPGDRLRASMHVLESRPSASRPGTGLIRTRNEATARRADGTEAIVLSMTGWSIFQRRKSSTED